MKLIINGHEYDATPLSEASAIILVHKTVAEMAQAYADFRSVDTFVLNGTTYPGRVFRGVTTLESGGNIQATYRSNTTEEQHIADLEHEVEVLSDKGEGYDILTGGE